ncbi:hypothetical protein J4558_20525 [Leptolyngbya sp. 15MV]|nr:hypothetical protein J4558_20525 [Leptolyngbya sp. 15MV]
MPWTDLVEAFLEDDATEHPVITLRLVLRSGVVLVMAELIEADRKAIARKLHVTVLSGALRPNALGPAAVRSVALKLMEMHGYDELIVEGGVRERGADRVHRPRPIRFTRKLPAGR